MNKIFDIWFKSLNVNLINYKKSWSQNGVGKKYAIFTNKATIKDKCFSFTIQFIYLVFCITIFDMDNIKIIKLIRKIKNKGGIFNG